MINESEIKRYFEMEKNVLIIGFLQMEEKLKGLQQNFDRLSAERNELLRKLTNVDLPKVVPQQQQSIPQFQKPQPQQMPRRVPEPVSVPEPLKRF